MRNTTVLLCLLLGACAGDTIASANPSSVIVQRETSVSNAAALAASHCSKFNKDARLAHSHGLIMSFDCVPR